MRYLSIHRPSSDQRSGGVSRCVVHMKLLAADEMSHRIIDEEPGRPLFDRLHQWLSQMRVPRQPRPT